MKYAELEIIFLQNLCEKRNWIFIFNRAILVIDSCKNTQPIGNRSLQQEGKIEKAMPSLLKRRDREAKE